MSVTPRQWGQPPGPPSTPEPMTPIMWLRALLDDRGTPSVDQVNAPGGGVNEFFVSSAPVSTLTSVTQNGGLLVQGSDYTVSPTLDSIVFAVAPALNDTIIIRYSTQTWSDDELNTWLIEASTMWTQPRHLVYQAAIFAVDSMMSGLATAFDFGSGQEDFRFSGSFDQLSTLRSTWQQWLDANGEQGVLQITDFTFDSIAPGDMADDPGDGVYGEYGGVFIDQQGQRGGLE